MSGRRAVRLILFIGLTIWAMPLRAQNDRPGVVRGVVFDSLITSKRLEGAEVWIERTNRTATSDAAGSFVLSAIPPGRYLLTFYHPILDSAGLSVAPVMVDVTSGDSTDVTLTTPGPEHAHHLLCPQDPLRRTGAILAL